MFFERKHGFEAVRVEVPEEMSDRARRVFHHYIDSSREPQIGFFFTSFAKFQKQFPPRNK